MLFLCSPAQKNCRIRQREGREIRNDRISQGLRVPQTKEESSKAAAPRSASFFFTCKAGLRADEGFGIGHTHFCENTFPPHGAVALNSFFALTRSPLRGQRRLEASLIEDARPNFPFNPPVKGGTLRLDAENRGEFAFRSRNYFCVCMGQWGDFEGDLMVLLLSIFN